MVDVRLATPADAGELARLRYGFRAGLNAAAEDMAAFVRRCAPWMEERLAEDSGWRCWVTPGRGEIGGHAWLQLIEKIPNPGAEREIHGYVTNVYVRPEARGAGAGEALVLAAMEFCRREGVDSVILWPTERSRSLYERLGFGPPGDMLEAVLDGGRDLP